MPEAWGHLAPIVNRPTRSSRAIIDVSSARLERRFEDRVHLLSRRGKDPPVVLGGDAIIVESEGPYLDRVSASDRHQAAAVLDLSKAEVHRIVKEAQ